MLEQFISGIQIIIIDIIMAADNAIIIGLIAANYAKENRKKIIAWGVAAAFIFRIIFAFLATILLEMAWLKIVGGVLLLWIVNNLRQDFFDTKKIRKSLLILIMITGSVFILKGLSRIILNYDTVYYQSPWPRIYENRDSLKNLNANSNLPITFKNELKSNLLKIYYINKLNYWTSDRSVTCMYNHSPCTQSSSNFDNFEIIKTPNNYYKIKLNKD